MTLRGGAAPKPDRAANVKHVGYVGALALALGLGAALASTPGVALADSDRSSSPQSSAERPKESVTGSDEAASVTRRSARSSARSERRADRVARREERRTSASRHISWRADATDTDAGSESVVLTDHMTTVPSAPDDPSTPAQRSLLLTTSVSAAARRTEKVTPDVTTDAGADGGDIVVEAESMTLSSPKNASVYFDSSASGGSAVLLSKNSSATTKVSLPASSGVVIRAKGDQFQGAPIMQVSIDGVAISTVSVSASSWTRYTVPFSAPAGTYTVSIEYTNDRSSGKSGDRNLRLDTITVIAAAVVPPSEPPTTGSPAYFSGADWLWKPIAANPVLATNSATWVSYLADPDELRIANLYEYGVTLVSASDVTASTPRYDVTFTQPWGGDPLGSTTVPIPVGTRIAPGSDGHIAILDPTTGTAFGLWQANYNSATDTWSASWGGMTAIDGDGVDVSGSATAASIARYAGVVTAEEFSAALAAGTGLGHALAFSTDLAGPDFVYPAAKSDGQNWAGVAVPLPEGYRIQLNPDLDVDAIAGITEAEKVIAKTLQTYGAYVVDQGGARMAFAFELVDDATSNYPGAVWADAGLAWDYYDMDAIPWSQLRVLAPAEQAV